MQQPQIVMPDASQKLPVLIIDKKGFIGKGLSRQLREEYLIVLVTADEVEVHKNVIHIPYLKKIPVIPDNAYSHIFVIYNSDGVILDMLASLAQKAQESSGLLYFISSLLYSSAKLNALLKEHDSSSIRIILFGETFSNRNTEANVINYFIHQAKVFGRIEVPNNGLGKIYPVLYDDVLHAIISVAFAKVRNSKLMYAFGQFPHTEIGLAHLLQKHNPLLKIDFKKQSNSRKDFYIPDGGMYLFGNYDLEAGLRHIDMTRSTSIPYLPKKKIKQATIIDPEKNQRNLLIFLTLVSSLLVAPIVLTFLLAVSGAGFLHISVSQAVKGNLQNAIYASTLSKSSFVATETLIPGLVLPSVFLPSQTEVFLENIRTGREVVDIEHDTLTAIILLKNIYQNNSQDPKNDFLHSLASIKNSLLRFQKLKAEDRLPASVVNKFDKYSGILQIVEGTIDTWPTIFGFEGKKSYLLLFQNNMELRPGGGFIGSYGILPVQNGKLGKLEINDVYDADGQLKVHVEPPFGLRRYLGATHWYLRDSNYDIDFIRNAVQSAKFLNLETGQDVNGVVAIDTSFLKTILSVIGPVTVTDYKETVNAENFYLKTQSHAEKDFFPGSTQKKDFLRSLTNAMLVKLLENKKYSMEDLLQKVELSIMQKHIMFAFSDPGVQNVFTVNKLSSSLRENRTGNQNTFLDFLSVVDANVGANKANYYIKRSISQDVRVDGTGALQAAIQVIYSNESSNNSPFGGVYKNYMRFILPTNAILQNIYFDKKEQEITPAVRDPLIYSAKSYIPPSSLEVEETELLGKKVLGFFVNVPPHSVKQITLSYRIPKAINLMAPAFTYNLQLFKQPGTDMDPYTLTFSYPNTFQIINKIDGSVDLGGKFSYTTHLDVDKNISVSFSKK